MIPDFGAGPDASSSVMLLGIRVVGRGLDAAQECTARVLAAQKTTTRRSKIDQK